MRGLLIEFAGRFRLQKSWKPLLLRYGVAYMGLDLNTCEYTSPNLSPGPPLFLSLLLQVVDLFANVEDATTGAQLFTPKTWRVYKATLKHIRKGCLSDRLDVNYYYLVKVTKDGYPVFRCNRGTSPLEDYHHHLRMIIAQSCLSPKLLVSLLRNFNYRWNVNMGVDNGDLPPFYRGWYCHEMVEEVQVSSEL
jgi:hypothetical protein